MSVVSYNMFLNNKTYIYIFKFKISAVIVLLTL